MIRQKGTVERRKSVRYKAVEGAYAAISPNSHKLGQIIDISMGGICFKYIDDNGDDHDIDTQQKSSIFLSSLGYYVGGLSFKTVDDYTIKNVPSFSSMNMRKRHIQFIDLNFKQLFDLDFYLRNNVVE
jgi:hypothetical protein